MTDHTHHPVTVSRLAGIPVTVDAAVDEAMERASMVEMADEILHCTGTAFKAGQCPSCGHAQHVGLYCTHRDANDIGCGCSPEKAAKADTGKARGWNLLAWDVIPELLGIYQYGISKGYLAESWRYVEPERYEDALMRHMTAHLLGERDDPESGKRHIAHVAWNALAIMALRK